MNRKQAILSFSIVCVMLQMQDTVLGIGEAAWGGQGRMFSPRLNNGWQTSKTNLCSG